VFDIGFSELLVIAVVALIVIGPERLPKVARTAGLLSGRLRRYVNDVKADISREMQLDELKKMQQEVADRIAAAESTVRHEMHEVASSVAQDIAPPGEETAELTVHQGDLFRGAPQEDLLHGASPEPTFSDAVVPEKTPAGLTTPATPTERT